MVTGKPFVTMATLCFAGAVGCAGPQAKATARREAPPLVEALDGLCRQVRTVAADPAICPQDRGTALKSMAEWRRIAASEQGTEIERAVETATREQRYAALVSLASQAGRPDWKCEELGRFVDQDPSFVRPTRDAHFLSNLDEYCRIVEKNDRDIPDAATRANATHREAMQGAGCAMKELLEALSMATGGARYSLMRQMAAEAGAPHWQCSALDPSAPR